MNLGGRTIGFLVMAGVTIASCLAFSNPSTNPAAGVVVWLPESIPGHEAKEGVMGAQEKKWLPLDTTHWTMTYTPTGVNEAIAGWQSVKATLIVAGTDSRSLHRPQVCLGAQGWAIKKREVVTLETKGGPLKVMDFHLSRLIRDPDDQNKIVEDEQGNPRRQRAHYVYWWIGPDHTTPDDKERVWRSMLNSVLKGRNERWAYPSVMTYVEEWRGDEGVADARKRAFQFIQEYAPGFQKSLGAKEGKPGSRNLVTLTE